MSFARGQCELLELALQAHYRQQGHWHDRGTPHRWGTSGAFKKHLSHQVALPMQVLGHVAQILLHCSLLPTERFLHRARGRPSPRECVVPTPAGDRRIWTGRAPYNPKVIIKPLEPLTLCSYCYEAPNRNCGNTPAMLLGLARGPAELRKLLEKRA
ncbi:hypothetical protein [Sediminicurvatus halobius]|uniref:hypothetical protein n=1 Tax=Sediminicurvatus halobius TaxID=2182432 RepID=UPI0011B22FE9|nr:hypothetical protein [Spiribacter halobius]UEX77650.1 hypothetical protein LMH63_17235 [Spiribacter halobius]